MTTFFPPKSKWQDSLPALCAAGRHAAAVALCVCLASENPQNSRSIGLAPLPDEVFTKWLVQCSWILLRTSFKLSLSFPPKYHCSKLDGDLHHVLPWLNRKKWESEPQTLFSPYFNCPGWVGNCQVSRQTQWALGRGVGGLGHAISSAGWQLWPSDFSSWTWNC